MNVQMDLSAPASVERRLCILEGANRGTRGRGDSGRGIAAYVHYIRFVVARLASSKLSADRERNGGDSHHRLHCI
jgi:hypothetical protein